MSLSLLMKIFGPSTSIYRELGIAFVREINMKTVQNVLIDFRKQGVRFAITDIALISNSVTSVSNGASVTLQEVDRATPIAATLSTTMTGTNNDVTLTAVEAGADGNAITLTLVDPPGNNVALSVAVTGTDIVVTLATDGSSVITTTGAQLIAAITADADASALVTIANKGADTGAGVVTALTETALSGGLDWTVKDTIVNSTDLADTDKVGLVQALTLVSDKEVLEGRNSLLLSITNGATATTDLKDLLVQYVVI